MSPERDAPFIFFQYLSIIGQGKHATVLRFDLDEDNSGFLTLDEMDEETGDTSTAD